MLLDTYLPLSSGSAAVTPGSGHVLTKNESDSEIRKRVPIRQGFTNPPPNCHGGTRRRTIPVGLLPRSGYQLNPGANGAALRSCALSPGPGMPEVFRAFRSRSMPSYAALPGTLACFGR